MSESVFLWQLWLVAAIGVTTFVVIFADSVVRSIQKRKEQENSIAGLEETFDQYRKEKEEWQERIYSLSHLLKGSSWQDSVGKEEFLRELYGDDLPQYLWYAVNGRRASQKELRRIYETFWGKKEPSFGDFEELVSYNSEVGTVLRIRNPENFAAEITVGGKTAPLYQAGHSMFGEDEKRCVSFLSLYNEKTLSENTLQ